MNEEDKDHFENMFLNDLAYNALITNLYSDPQTKEVLDMLRRYGNDKKTAEAIMFEILQIGEKHKNNG